MEVNRITFQSYDDLNEQCIRQHCSFYHRVYRAVSKHHPNGTIAEVMLIEIARCEDDYKLLDSTTAALTKAFRNATKIFKNGE